MSKPKKTTRHVVPTKDGKWAVIDGDRVRSAAPAEGRKASASLYVMVEPDQKRRYEAAAEAAGMTLREYVTNALDAYIAEQTLTISPENVSKARAFFEDKSAAAAEASNYQNLALRLGTLEKKFEALQNRVDEQWGPQFPPREWFDDDGNLKPVPPKRG